MNLTILAIGKAGRGPEAELCTRYLDRAGGAGRAVGLSPVTLRELPDGAGPRRTDKEAASLIGAHSGGKLVLLDERGRSITSLSLARTLERWQSDGEPAINFAIGGADGHGAAVRQAASEVWSLSDLTLPHLLARVVLLEQIYRAVTILSGHPYHRA